MPSPIAIETVELGGRVADASMFLHLTDMGQPLEIVYRLWVLRTDRGAIVVDTGPPMEEGLRRGLTGVAHVADRLAARGVNAAKVEAVLLTHLHWDHAANAAAFPNATFYAQQAEIDFFRSPMRTHKAIDRFFSHQAMIEALIRDGRIKALDGDAPFMEGIRTIHVGGHTPGSQMIAVDSAEGLSILTGDAVPVNRNYTDSIPSGILVNLQQAIAALATVRALKPRRLYTGHDPKPYLELAGA